MGPNAKVNKHSCVIGSRRLTHDTLIISVHHAAQRGKGTSHEDIGVLNHANQSMGLLSIVATDDRLTDVGVELASIGEAAETLSGHLDEKSATLMLETKL